MTIREILDEKGSFIVSMWPEHTLEEAIRLADERNISAIVITDHQRLPVGVLTDRDALRALARYGTRALNMPVTQVMHSPAPVCGAGDRTTDILRLMTHERVRHVVVMDAGRMAGLVSIGDLVKAKLRDADLESRVLRDRALSRLAAE